MKSFVAPFHVQPDSPTIIRDANNEFVCEAAWPYAKKYRDQMATSKTDANNAKRILAILNGGAA